MTLTTTTSKISYAGDGSTVSFSIPFLFLTDGDITATLRSSAGTETTWVLNTQYTLAGAGVAAGGTLTVKTSPTDYTPAGGETLVIRRIVPETQGTDYPEGGAFPASAHEDALDKLTMLVQQKSEELARALVFPTSDPASSLGEVPNSTDRASKFLGFDASGKPIASTGSVDTLVVSAFMATVLDDVDASTARTTLGLGAAATKNFGTAANQLVELDGSAKLPAVDGSQLTGLPEAGANKTDMRLAFLLIAENAGDRLNMIDGIADPFTDETDVDTGANVNAIYDAPGDFYANGETTLAGTFANGTSDGGLANYSRRTKIPASAISGSATKIKIKLQAYSGAGIDIDDMFVGHAAASGNAWDFESAPTRVQFSGADNISLGAGGTATSDAVTFTIDDTKDLIIAFDIAASGGANAGRETISGHNVYHKASADEASVTAPSGYTTIGGINSLISGVISAAGADMTLQSNAFTADAAPATGRIHIQVKPIDAITPNTDLVAEISRDDGTTFTTATLALKETLADGTKAYEDESLDISGQPSGTAMKWRIKTLNNKEVEAHGVVLQWT